MATTSQFFIFFFIFFLISKFSLVYIAPIDFFFFLYIFHDSRLPFSLLQFEVFPFIFYLNFFYHDSLFLFPFFHCCRFFFFHGFCPSPPFSQFLLFSQSFYLPIDRLQKIIIDKVDKSVF